MAKGRIQYLAFVDYIVDYLHKLGNYLFKNDGHHGIGYYLLSQ
jgi:hypothetical protein